MIQYKKLMMTLALLLTAATGAWAQSLHSFDDLIDEIGSGGDITLHYDYYKYESGYPIEITSSGVIDGNGAIIDMEGATISHVFNISADNVTIKNLSIINYTGTGDAIYFSRSGGSVYNIGYDVALNRVTTANTWTLSMPSGNVLLTPQYAAVAKWAVESAGTTDEKTLLPAAAEGVIAGTDAPLIKEGTGIVAFAGTSTEVTQGTVMYAVTAATATTAPALTSSDWKNTVPTAKDIADEGAEVKVWYYIQGADAPANEAATLDNTFNNSDVCATPLTVSVRSNKFDLTFKAANANTIEAGMATVTVDGTDKTSAIAEGKLKAIKMGSEVKLNTATGYKFRKVEVKKAKPVAKLTAAPEPWTVHFVGTSLLQTPGTAEGGTLMYKVTKTNVTPETTEGFSIVIPVGVENGPSYKNYIWYYIKGDENHSDSEIFGPIEVSLSES